MVSNRRIGLENSETRGLLLDAAERVICEEGYAAASSRRIAKRAGLKPQLVYYYFRTMDDLFVALIRRRVNRSIESLARALTSKHPLRAAWEFNRAPIDTVLSMELMAMANHRKAVGMEIKHAGEQILSMQVGAASGSLQEGGLDPDEYPPVAVMLLINAISRCIVMENKVGSTVGHGEIEMIVERWLRRLEGAAQRAAVPARSRGRRPKADC